MGNSNKCWAFLFAGVVLLEANLGVGGAREVVLGSTRLLVLVTGLRAAGRGDLGVPAFLLTARKFCLVGDRVGSGVLGCLLGVVGAVA